MPSLKTLLSLMALANFAPVVVAFGQGELRVTLFDQPCVMTGPYEEKVLSSIHSISPEQVPPGAAEEVLQRMLYRLKGVETLPPALDSYRTRLTEYLKRQLAFESSLTLSRKRGSRNELEKAIRSQLRGAKSEEALEVIRKLPARPSSWTDAQSTKARAAFEKAIGGRPEEEFHRAVGGMRIRYDCEFDERSGQE